MERLYSPWRSEFIAGAADANSPRRDSPFQRAWNDPQRDADNYLVHRGTLAFIIMNRYPYNAGHLLVVPVRVVADVLDLTDEEFHEMNALTRLGIALLRRALAPQGLNVGMNLGRTAGAGIDFHVHMHIVPRWNGDTNFMPVLDETRVISEAMQDVYHKLRAAREVLLNDPSNR